MATVLKRLDAGDPFHVVATQYSDDEAAARVDDVGFFHKGKMDPAFEAAAFAREVGDISEPVFSVWCSHNPPLGEKAAEVIPFELARERLITQLKKQKAVDLRQSVLLPFRSEIDSSAVLDEERIAKKYIPD